MNLKLKKSNLENIIDYSEYNTIIFEDKESAERVFTWCERNQKDLSQEYQIGYEVAQVGFDHRFHSPRIDYIIVHLIDDDSYALFVVSDYSGLTDIFDCVDVADVLERLPDDESYASFMIKHPMRAMRLIQDVMKEFNIASITLKGTEITPNDQVFLETSADDRYYPRGNILKFHKRSDLELIEERRYNTSFQQIYSDKNDQQYQQLYLHEETAYQSSPDYTFEKIDKKDIEV